MSFEKDLATSKLIFEKIKPYIEKDTKSKIYAVEGEDNALKTLDIYAGIDYLLVSKKGIRGLASRIQAGNSYQTFTVRAEKASGAKTEFEKRVDALSEDYLYPYYTMQAYYQSDKIEYAICRTKDLYRFILNNEDKVKKNRTTNAEFYIVNWYFVPCYKKVLVRQR